MYRTNVYTEICTFYSEWRGHSMTFGREGVIIVPMCSLGEKSLRVQCHRKLCGACLTVIVYLPVRRRWLQNLIPDDTRHFMPFLLEPASSHLSIYCACVGAFCSHWLVLSRRRFACYQLIISTDWNLSTGSISLPDMLSKCTLRTTWRTCFWVLDWRLLTGRGELVCMVRMELTVERVVAVTL